MIVGIIEIVRPAKSALQSEAYPCWIERNARPCANTYLSGLEFRMNGKMNWFQCDRKMKIPAA